MRKFMRKFKVVLMIITLFSALSFGFFSVYKAQPIYVNKGKKALINGRDSCMIVSEEKEYFLRSYPRQITVMYKDGYGKYVEQQFDADLITIIK